MAGSSSTAAHGRAKFKPFVWNSLEGLDHEARARASFLNDARDVVDGAHTLMQLLAWDEAQRDEANAANARVPLLDAVHRASLQRFVVAALGRLHADIEGQCETLDAMRR